jgi:hypothetical protein
MPTEAILQILENGKWHHLKDLEHKTHLDSFKIENITEFLVVYNFVKLDKTKQKVKLDPPANKFLKKIRQIENEENTKHF